MAEIASQSSESMEDILQSIKRIIENDTDATSKDAPAPAGDILELTQIVTEDGKVTSLSKTAKLPPMDGEEPVREEKAAPAVEETFKEEEGFAPVSQSMEPFPEPDDEAFLPPKAKPAMREEGLVSDQAAQAALAALKPITDSAHHDYSIPRVRSPELRDGTTVEDLLLEALRPMLKSWLDEHLPMIVQKIVEKEVRRIVAFHKD